MVSAATAAALEVRGVSKIFPTPEGGEVRALDDVSLDIAAGEFFILLGPSGCGKTTLLRLIAGLEYPDAGEINLGGERLDVLPPWKRNVNTVFQSYALFPHMTIAENIAFGLEMEGADKATISARVQEMLELVRLTGYESRRPSQLSGGQQQRVALARALAKRPSVLLLDEPLSALDLKLRRGMQVELKAIQQQTGVTFVFVTHDQEEAMSMGDRIAVFSNGKIAQLGTPRDVYEHPVNSYVADFVGETNLLTAAVESAPEGVSYRINGSGRVAHRDLDASSPTPHDAQTDAVLAIRPEHLVLSDQPVVLQGVQGTVAVVTYVGSDIRLTVSVGEGRVVVRVPARVAAPNVGDVVTLDALPGVVRVVAGADVA